ncbi:hypothetical protein BCR43DRAFT_487564 [Syncephalastrum racemosum]|uniref:MYND-type domain-containing protein n=1 Tax=Syncephalastrum racemosum TaxID=13706 RepID=A0A1X2HH73_SYNRA|nr:hypothetical protein BCR43DRAFT_487564 [Syncephalastrum racemosum]
MKLAPRTVAYTATAVTLTAGLCCLIYFDYKRHHDPETRRYLKRQRKLEAKNAQVERDQAKRRMAEIAAGVIDKVAHEEVPTLPAARDEYVKLNLLRGEELSKLGESSYAEAAACMYAIVKLDALPLELVEQVVPPAVYDIVLNCMALERLRREESFYRQYPPTDMAVTLDGQRRFLIAKHAFSQGNPIFTESAHLSVLHPALEGQLCHLCMRSVEKDTKAECPNCDRVIFCSKTCEQKASTYFHGFLCTNNKISPKQEESSFFECPTLYPSMIARFLSSMVAEEMELKAGEAAYQTQEKPFTQYEYLERLPNEPATPSTHTTEERERVTRVLSTKVPGIEQFLREENYLELKGYFQNNSFAVSAPQGLETQMSSSEPCRRPPTDSGTRGLAFYLVASSLHQAKNQHEANCHIVFREGDSRLTVIATRDIAQGDRLNALYVQ